MEWLDKLTPQQRAIANKVAAEADRQGVPRELALAAAMQESSFKPQAKSKTGPVGVMMLGRAAAKEQGVNRYNLDQNIRGGVGYLKQNLEQQGGDPQRALIAYHDGPNSDFFKGRSMSPAAYNHLQKVKSYGGFQGDLIPMAAAKQDDYPDVRIGEVEPLPDFLFSEQQATPKQPPGFGTAAQVGSAGIGALIGMRTAPSVGKQADINQSLIQAANASNVPIKEANAARQQQYEAELEQRKRLLDAITESQKSKGVPGYVETQLQGGAQDVVKQDPRVISTRTAQSVIPEFESGNLRAQEVNRGQLVSDPNRFGGLSVPPSALAPAAPTPQELVTRQLGPEPMRPTPRPLNTPQVQPIRSMTGQGALTGALTGYNALRAAEAMRSNDVPQSVLGTAGTVSGAIANQARSPKVAIPAALVSGASAAGSKLLDYLRGEKEPEVKSVLNKAEGGLTSLPKYAGRGESLVKGFEAAKNLWRKAFPETARSEIQKILPAAERENNLAAFRAASADPRLMFHGTANFDSKNFIKGTGGWGPADKAFTSLEPSPQSGLAFLSPHPNFANWFTQHTPYGKNKTTEGFEGGAVYPVYAQVKNPFDYENPAHVGALEKALPQLSEEARQQIPAGGWTALEKPDVLNALRNLGHDAVYVKEGDAKNLGVFDPRNIKSAIGNRGTYDTSTNKLGRKTGGLV